MRESVYRSFGVTLVWLVTSLCGAYAQMSTDLQTDIALVQSKALEEVQPIPKRKPSFGWIGKSAVSRYNPISLLLSSTLYSYQRVMSAQISSDCPYQLSCSAFAKASLAEFGLFKGMALAADRLTRCNKLAGADFHPVRFNSAGKLEDFPVFYHFHP